MKRNNAAPHLSTWSIFLPDFTAAHFFCPSLTWTFSTWNCLPHIQNDGTVINNDTMLYGRTGVMFHDMREVTMKNLLNFYSEFHRHTFPHKHMRYIRMYIKIVHNNFVWKLKPYWTASSWRSEIQDINPDSGGVLSIGTQLKGSRAHSTPLLIPWWSALISMLIGR